MSLTANLDRHQSRAMRLVRPGNTVVLLFGRGSGKSFLDRLIIHTQALQNPGSDIGLLMPTLKQARQVFWPHLLDDFYGPLRAHLKGEPNKTLLEATYANGSRLTTWGAENADGIRGQRFRMIVQDEADEIDPSVETAVVEPTFSRSGRNAIWVKSGTPKRGRYGILFRDYQLATVTKLDGYHVVKVRSSESPQVDQQWLAKVKAKTDKTIFAREYDVDFDAAEGLVYIFLADVHIRIPHSGVRFDQFIVGVDHGWNDPGVFLLIGISGRGDDAFAWVLDEFYRSETPIHVWASKAREWSQKYGADLGLPQPTFFCDRSQPLLINNLVNSGIDARGVQQENIKIESGVARVADMLAVRENPVIAHRAGLDGTEAPRLFIHPRCVNTIREFGVYRRKRDPNDHERYLEQIEDKSNHAMDSLRYALTERFGLPTIGKHIASGR